MLLRTNPDHPDYKLLIPLLDAYLAITDGDEHNFYDQFNKSDEIKYVVLAYEGGVAVACGAIKQFDDHTMEVKRMFTQAAFRGQGIAAKVLTELEQWTLELGFDRCILETGTRQQPAIRLYQKCGYRIMPNYGQYIGVANSVCMQKLMRKTAK